MRHIKQSLLGWRPILLQLITVILMFLYLSRLCLSRPCSLIPPPLPWSSLLQEGLTLVPSIIIPGVHARAPTIPPHSPCRPTTASSMVSTNPLFLPPPRPPFSPPSALVHACTTLRCFRRAIFSFRRSSRRVSALYPSAAVGWNSTSFLHVRLSSAAPRPTTRYVPLFS